MKKKTTWKCDVARVRSVQVLVTQLSDRGFLFLLSSGQMAPPTGETGGEKDFCLETTTTFPWQKLQTFPPFCAFFRARGALEEVSPGAVRLPRAQRRGQIQ